MLSVTSLESFFPKRGFQHENTLNRSMPRLRYFARRSLDVLELENLFKGIPQTRIKTFVLSAISQEREIRLHRIEIPRTSENQELLQKISIKDFNKRHNSYAVVCYVPTLWSTDLNNGNRTPPTDIFNRRELDISFFRKDISHTDLQHLPFISIDSAGVRKDAQAVYGDIDDAVYAEKKGAGFCIRLAFADITPFSRLEADDALLLNAKRFGYSVYGVDPHLAMIGSSAERQCSLLENEARFAWIVQFDVNSTGIIDYENSKIYRAKIRNRMQMEYDTNFEPEDKSELATCLRNARRAASLLKLHKDPKHALAIYTVKGETSNADAVSQFMIHARNVAGKLVSAKTSQAIYRIQHMEPGEKEISIWNNDLKNLGYSSGTKLLSNPNSLAGLLLDLISNSNPQAFELGIGIFDYLTGRACYSLHPGQHQDLRFEPYLELKGLRKLTGFVNQHVLQSIFEPDGFEIEDQLIQKLCNLANEHRRSIEELTAFRVHINLEKT